VTAPLPHGIILAAGAGRRYGGAKQLAPIDGVPMLQRVLDTLHAALAAAAPDATAPSIIVVLGAHAPAVRAAIDFRDARVVECAEWERGMAHSLRCGLAALGATPPEGIDPSPTAALVMLGDTPYITAADLQRLIAAWQAAPDTPAAAEYDGTVGAPCILPRTVWPELAALEGDRGAGAWLRTRERAGGALRRAVITDAARDIDHPQRDLR
jgi:CTP:molybdopterin cytidylyltransferase MocA